MIYIKEEISLSKYRLAYTGLDDAFDNGEDVVFIEKLRQTLELQKKISIRLKMKTITPPEPYTMFNINEVIEAINMNFKEIENKINNLNGTEEIIGFDNFKEMDLFFSDYNKVVNLSINNKEVNIKSGDTTYKYDVSTDLMEKE